MGATAGFTAAGMMVAGSVQTAMAQQAAGRLQAKQAELNSKIAEMQADDAIRRGSEDARTVVREGKRVIGAQRAALAAQGVSLSDGSALEVQMDTASQVAKDAATIRRNARREAWGYKINAINESLSGSIAAYQGRAQARGTILSGAGSAIGYAGQGYEARAARSSSSGSAGGSK